MTDYKKFKRGHRTYTRVGTFKEVRIDSGSLAPDVSSPSSEGAPISMHMKPSIESGQYSNAVLVHKSTDELIVDFAFIQPQPQLGHIFSRVILSYAQAKRFSRLLNHALADNHERI